MKKSIVIIIVAHLHLTASQQEQPKPSFWKRLMGDRVAIWNASKVIEEQRELFNKNRDKDQEKDKDDKYLSPYKGAGSDVGANFGAGTVTIIGQGIAMGAGAVKATVVSVVAAPATPFIVGGVAGTYVAYKAYRYFRPSQQQKEAQSASEKRTAENERDKVAATVEVQEKQELQQCKKERDDFTSCMHTFRKSQRLTRHGYPEECSDQAHKLSMHKDGESEVLSLAKRHVMFAPLKNQGGDK